MKKILTTGFQLSQGAFSSLVYQNIDSPDPIVFVVIMHKFKSRLLWDGFYFLMPSFYFSLSLNKSRLEGTEVTLNKTSSRPNTFSSNQPFSWTRPSSNFLGVLWSKIIVW